MSEIIICSRKECQTTAGCQCGATFNAVRDDAQSELHSLRQRVEALEKALNCADAVCELVEGELADLKAAQDAGFRGLRDTPKVSAQKSAVAAFRRARSVLEGEKT